MKLPVRGILQSAGKDLKIIFCLVISANHQLGASKTFSEEELI
jgi:hypothetical protein